MHDDGSGGPGPDGGRGSREGPPRHGRFFGAVSAVAGRLLELADWTGVDEALRRLGEGASVQRVCIFENHSDQHGTLLCSLRHEWLRPGMMPQADQTFWQAMPIDATGFGRWRRHLERGEVFAANLDDLPAAERRLLIDQSVRSLAVVPVYVQGAWWGILTLEDCRRKRRWSDGERDALQVVARLFASFILRLRGTRSLIVSEARYRSIVQALPDFIFRIDEHMRFVDVQASEPQKLFVPAEQALGRTPSEILPPDGAALAERHFAAAFATGEMQVYDYALEVRGKLVEHEIRIVPCTDNELLAIVRDVTEMRDAERRLRQSEARYTAVVNDQTELICRFHPDGALTFVNEAYCRFFGKRREDLIGSSFAPLIPEPDRDLVRRMFGSLSAERPLVTYEHRVIHADGGVRWTEWTDRAVCDQRGRVVEYQAVGRDVTERKQLQGRLLDVAVEQQHKLAQELHDELCQDLKSLEIEAALLEDRLASSGDPDLSGRAAAIGRQANLATRKAYAIVRGMLPVGLEATELAAALGALVERLRDRAGCPIVSEIDQDLLPVDRNEAHHLYHIAQEALGNALRHARAAEIRLTWRRREDQAQLTIRDDGIGFDATAVRSGRRGVGLAVLESRAQAIGALLRVESEPGRGTEVRCRLGAREPIGGRGAP